MKELSRTDASEEEILGLYRNLAENQGPVTKKPVNLKEKVADNLPELLKEFA